MNICDFCSAAKLILSFVGESKSINQMDLMYELFKDFIESDYGYDFEFDNGLVCRWLNGTAKISSKITAYYLSDRNIESMAIGIEEHICPLVQDYIYDGFVPKPCRHFKGRNNELEMLHSALDNNSKIFVEGVAGIGKSEFVKMYASKYKKEYTDILYFNYGGNLKQIITDCDFTDDTPNENEDLRFERHNRFLRSLKKDTLIIIDNFNTIASDEHLFDMVMKYRCKIVFTTRSCFSDYASFELKELSEDNLLRKSLRSYAEGASNSLSLIRRKFRQFCKLQNNVSINLDT